ncbi:uncharacterized protein PHALS_02747 [Plasmopara halstedii]|uniref:Uncharacterized protein n=1 Tax=Plasmopara halstedii TaxID=4781 RepID=A0A0P1AV94_PLAHL|nr:uncharacterized protein PHALS_02747 [Plasmopara halstedii]CEG46343.1 hypothetical protein PHALS_02747 [Plasmopara halstedii]|eukprot:XP_024582712.1 hypothetical protein PHALS_02747 [Plasmopara halstedii]
MRPASSPATVPSSNKNNLLSVAADTASIKETKDALLSDSDSPTSTAVDLTINQIEEDLRPENVEEQEIEWGDDTVKDEIVSVDPESLSNKKRRRVSFECADIVEFEPTAYTTSVTSGGVPVGLSLNERSRSRRRLDSFEMERVNVRVGRQNYMEEGYLDPQEREVILNNAGCEEPVIASAEAEVNAIIQNRRESNEIDFDFMYGSSEIEIYEADEEINVLSYDHDVGTQHEEQQDVALVSSNERTDQLESSKSMAQSYHEDLSKAASL